MILMSQGPQQTAIAIAIAVGIAIDADGVVCCDLNQRIDRGVAASSRRQRYRCTGNAATDRLADRSPLSTLRTAAPLA
jgi:hypothetical protein